MSTRFEVWAPFADRVDVVTGDIRRHPMNASDSGWWRADVQDAAHGTDYGFILNGADEVLPDPRSPWQPNGVHGQSRVYDHERFSWTDRQWHGRPLPGSVLYEMHVGTFTPEGTFDAAVERLDHLVSLGVDAVELLPVAAFPGRRGWGYDGVHLWAPHEPYGGPDGLKRFVDAAHARGLAVVLDVVYNHLGPDGNRLAGYGPYFTDSHTTPWGEAVNFDQEGSDEVRAFVVQNALMWLRDYHFDGLRLDAVHAITDHSAVHILEELARAVAGLSAHLGRELFLIAESDLNDPRLVTSREAGGHGMDAQWSDDFHHALHAALTGERQGYYCDFGSLETLKKALTNVFVHDGTMSTYRGRHHGRPVDVQKTPAHRFIGFLQNHDQIGNRAAGDRIGTVLESARIAPSMLKVGAALFLLAPFTPMLFMGEEWGASTPWCYFTDHQTPELARAVTEGRRREFARHGWTDDVPDPQAVETFRRSVLDWTEPDRPHHRDLLEWHRSLLALRRSRPELNDPRLTGTTVETTPETPEGSTDRWLIMWRGGVCVAANLGETPVDLPISPPARAPEAARPRLLLASNPAIHLHGDMTGDTGTDRIQLPGTSVAVLG
ncbi:maltooligosyl trehalose hydrolase [Actinomadura pelletieri DSM 43383]|uniref:Malto-oligosyltrehalose trehalohydrolase n=1 Tax=Actinomadura pelletieri DSM 43383 TaxID=1120940 RepID=A0A495QS90_9ACTN|nr:malto-oligosyltrehalose trehalohydrolase [Actinomadura pelletieri]RKS76317.1 maltooligosyl trehalose hydrolase [Actinomadura pelletieri DSM 43383]